MFKGFTLEQQREIEVQRGWKPSYSALTYCTAEAVIFRKPPNNSLYRNVLGYEILDAERTGGAPDCLGKRQGKWGAYVYPTDPTARDAFKRGLKEQFGWDVPLERLRFAGVVGPWLHKATARLGGSFLVLSVKEEQAEQTPFEAKLFSVNATGFDIGPQGNYLKATRDMRWISLRDLIAEQGQNQDYLYWLMIARCMEVEYDSMTTLGNPFKYFAPGEYKFRVDAPPADLSFPW